MIETITTSARFVCTVIYYCFYGSYKTGQFLVTSINLLLQGLVICLSNFLEIVIIIVESFTIFCQDVVQGLRYVFQVILNVLETVQVGFSTAWCDTVHAIETLGLATAAVYNFIVNFITSIMTGITQVFVLFKRVVVLFGSGVWFSITFIPLLIVYIGTLFTYYVGRLFEELIDSISTSIWTTKVLLTNIYEFLTDVPVESAAGILVASCLLYILTQFYIVIYSYVYLQFRNALRSIYRRYSRIRRQRNTLVNQRPAIGTRMLPRSRPQIRRELNTPVTHKNECIPDDRYCVICQERVKCILVLPCRHVCMCNECNVRLQLYNNTCPICRNDIESTMKIFV